MQIGKSVNECVVGKENKKTKKNKSKNTTILENLPDILQINIPRFKSISVSIRTNDDFAWAVL